MMNTYEVRLVGKRSYACRVRITFDGICRKITSMARRGVVVMAAAATATCSVSGLDFFDAILDEDSMGLASSG